MLDQASSPPIFNLARTRHCKPRYHHCRRRKQQVFRPSLLQRLKPPLRHSFSTLSALLSKSGNPFPSRTRRGPSCRRCRHHPHTILHPLSRLQDLGQSIVAVRPVRAPTIFCKSRREAWRLCENACLRWHVTTNSTFSRRQLLL